MATINPAFMNRLREKSEGILVSREETQKRVPPEYVKAPAPKITDAQGLAAYAESRTILEVPFREKDEAKRLGAWWCPDIRKWYVPRGHDVTPFQRWIPTPSDATDSLTVNIELILNRRRIDVTFGAVPDQRTTLAMKEAGFSPNLTGTQWWRQDTKEAREFLARYFNTTIEDSETVTEVEASAPEVKEATTAPVLETENGTEVSPEYRKFKEQVDRLQEHLKLSAADLMLMAIDSLYRETFTI